MQSLSKECDKKGHKQRLLHSRMEEENEEVIVNEAYESTYLTQNLRGK